MDIRLQTVYNKNDFSRQRNLAVWGTKHDIAKWLHTYLSDKLEDDLDALLPQKEQELAQQQHKTEPLKEEVKQTERSTTPPKSDAQATGKHNTPPKIGDEANHSKPFQKECWHHIFHMVTV